MPGRELPSRTGSAREQCRPPGTPYNAASAVVSSQQRVTAQREMPPRKREPKQVQPQALPVHACENCIGMLHSTQKVRDALGAVLANARMIFLDDTLHHQMDDERWIRVLRAVGEDKSKYYARTVVVSNPKGDMESK